jgi:glycosyltransferase involved in cell wall biosynthesis
MAKILYVTVDDAREPTSENNGYYLGEALAHTGVELEYFQLRNFTLLETAVLGTKKVIRRARGRQYRAKVDPKIIQKKIQTLCWQKDLNKYDLVFSNGGLNVGSLGSDIPYAFYTDAPIAALKDMGHYMEGWPPQLADEVIEFDRRAVVNAVRVIYHSEWAVNQAVSAYGVDRSKFAVVAPGANIPWVPRSQASLTKPRGNVCELLFFGRDWIRKGGVQAQDITRRLAASGIATRLHICGPANRPASTLDDVHVIWHPPINKGVPGEMERLQALMQNTDYLLLPTRADTSTSAIREACAFGVPAIVTTVGGLSSMVRDGLSGILIQDSNNEDSVARRIRDNFLDDSQRLSFRTAARKEYEIRMNWTVAGQGIVSALGLTAMDQSS